MRFAITTPAVPPPQAGHFGPGYNMSAARTKIMNEGGRGLNHTITKTSTVGIMVHTYLWTDLFVVPNGQVVHLSANCPSVIKARGACTRLTTVDYGNYHNVRICDHCIKRGP